MADLDPREHRCHGVAGPARFSAGEFIRMVGVGLFRHRRIELLDGELRELSPVHNRHRFGQSSVFSALDRALAGRPELIVVFEPLVEFDDGTVRLPDVAVIDRPPPEATHNPSGAMRLAVEVADSSIADDLGERLRRYASARLPLYWVVDVAARVIHVCRDPLRDGYASRRVVPFGQPLDLLPLSDDTVAPDLELAVSP